MRRRSDAVSAESSKGSSGGDAIDKSTDGGAKVYTKAYIGNPRRSSFVWLALFLIITYCCSAIYIYQFQSMPVPLTADQAGKRGFSEIEPIKHVKALTEVGPHPVGSDALNLALQVWFLNFVIFSPLFCCIPSDSMLVGNPGSTPEWLGNFVIAAFIAALLSLTLVYLLSYVHISGAKRAIILSTLVLFSLSLAIVLSGVLPPFSEDTARAVNVVHVVDATGRPDEGLDPVSYVSLFSTTPGNLNKEIEQINEGFVCGRDKTVDFVTFSVKYGCWTYNDSRSGRSESDIPTIQFDSDAKENGRITQVSINTKGSVPWALAINTQEIEDFESGSSTHNTDTPLLKLRTDVNRLTPITQRVLTNLPSWCSLFGKFTSPHTLAFLINLPINF
ncbi:hypothetical protein Lalb_Chr06g0162341 [Lupinus albus]|uniref:Uncharacterized protein n=1 Tax=Lupinus albus TaxID=3870 RepID=A0A6A4QB04_LUPAL|nr:hypothetical protein Lalb_Chr06g0162341 [Lupinus albus]